MEKKTTTLLIILAAVVVLSCSKSDPGPSRSMLITQNDWKYNSFTSTDAYLQSYITLALTGSELHFSTDKTTTLTFTTSPTPSTYSWSFSADEKNLTLTDSSTSIVYEVTLLDGTNLQFRTSGAIINVYKYVKK